MAYTDATLVDGSQYKRRVQALVSADMLPYESALGSGLVIGHLPKRIFIIGIYITTEDGSTWDNPVELYINGIAAPNIANKTMLSDKESVVEVKRQSNSSGITSPYWYIIVFIDMDADDGLTTEIVQPAIASDGSIAVRR